MEYAQIVYGFENPGKQWSLALGSTTKSLANVDYYWKKKINKL